MFQKLRLALARMQVELSLFVVKTALVVVREQVFDKKAFVDHVFDLLGVPLLTSRRAFGFIFSRASKRMPPQSLTQTLLRYESFFEIVAVACAVGVTTKSAIFT